VEWIQKDQLKVQWSALVNRIRNVRSHVLTAVPTNTQVFRDKMLCQVVNLYIGADNLGELAASSCQVQVVHCYYLYYLTTGTLKQDTLKHEYPLTKGHSTISWTSTATTVMFRYWKIERISWLSDWELLKGDTTTCSYIIYPYFIYIFNGSKYIHYQPPVGVTHSTHMQWKILTW